MYTIDNNLSRRKTHNLYLFWVFHSLNLSKTGCWAPEFIEVVVFKKNTQESEGRKKEEEIADNNVVSRKVCH